MPPSSDLLLYTNPTAVLKTWSQDVPPVLATAPSISHVGLAPSAKLTLWTDQDFPCPIAHRPQRTQQALHTGQMPWLHSNALHPSRVAASLPAGRLHLLWTSRSTIWRCAEVTWIVNREPWSCLVGGQQHSCSAVQLGVCVACLLAAHLPPHRQHPAPARCHAKVVSQHLCYATLIAV